MFRLRRFRLFLFLSIAVIAGIFYLSDRSSISQSFSTSTFGIRHAKPFANEAEQKPLGAADDSDLLTHIQEHDLAQVGISKDSVKATDGSSRPQIQLPGPGSNKSPSIATPPSADPAIAKTPAGEHFPVPPSKLIRLPSGKPIRIPKIQADFARENAADLEKRQTRLAAIRAAFKKHWDGYKKFAWGHDELKPVSGGFDDPFAGWGATLVDSLDTMWIMGMKDEFENALEKVAEIDFTTTSRHDIPLFEVTIRYLGGLLGAYDISGRQYPILLEKATQLGEMLMGAFDTPNRMPITYYQWYEHAKVIPKRAGHNVVLAEIGSLSMEFTRLAQLTKQNKYYDAVARITNEFYDWQLNTKLPGLWPTYLDANGCGMIIPNLNNSPATTRTRGQIVGSGDSAVVGPPLHASEAHLAEPIAKKLGGAHAEDLDTAPSHVKDAALKAEEDLHASKAKIQARAADEYGGSFQKRREEFGNLPDEKCALQGLASTWGSSDSFTLGAMADSAYEYLPKEYLLLGGLNKQYREMHESAMAAIKDYLIYRPMIEDEKRKILFTGSFLTNGNIDEKTGLRVGSADPGTGHLTCFVGAVVGLGAKIFDKPADLEIAKQLADSCAWAYNTTVSGIMPEDMYPVPCETSWEEPCAWNKTHWWYTIDPWAESRAKADLEHWEEQLKRKQDAAKAAGRPPPKIPSAHTKRQIDLNENPYDIDGFQAGRAAAAAAAPAPAPHPASGGASSSNPYDIDAARDYSLVDDTTVLRSGRQPGARPKNPGMPAPPQPAIVPPRPASLQQPGSPVLPTQGDPDADDAISPRPLTHAQAMEARIAGSHLYPGISRHGGTNYILRPEAIESVFYMYRMTADPAWRDKGWAMWSAIHAMVDTKYGASAIRDVNVSPDQMRDNLYADKAESFWTGETLKYFYLLFAEESVVSLDEWVFNTEAHPFRIPKERYA